MSSNLKNYSVFAAFIFTSVAHANIVEITAVPTSWKVENYVPGGVATWFSGSVCSNGQLTFLANSTEHDQNRYWSALTAAKLGNRAFFVRYEDSLPGCPIMSFGAPQYQ